MSKALSCGYEGVAGGRMRRTSSSPPWLPRLRRRKQTGSGGKSSSGGDGSGDGGNGSDGLGADFKMGAIALAVALAVIYGLKRLFRRRD
ncbi:hypothetical protein [Streptomyces sp. NBC_00827]|uniref:hypothetical protein n=1 Tax=Streptomyces sp. NBC_00827 TaxID=2903677 RepID=UPI00386906E2|nr:hypothetical protein OG569_08320 [Streptomyces sp. NBC_00827]